MTLSLIGWREWVALPELGIKTLRAKIDSGAKTSVLHAFLLEPFYERGQQKVRFAIHPFQRRTDKKIVCIAPVADRRVVSDSGGHREERYVIHTPVVLGKKRWWIDITLTNRDSLTFRMLLGRAAIAHRFVVDPGASYLQGKPLRGEIRKI